MFDKRELDDLPPPHLLRIPIDAATTLVSTIISELPHMPASVRAELLTFTADPTVWNAGRLINALRYAGHPGLAREVEDVL
ncbi:MAG: hypothetical protein J2P50_15510 [Hyphomicrobiaceae bacterium]|nr:hypothetical protein [Hyphomicrobiaceae bacterium]